MGLKIEKLIECKGAGRYGTCIGCGRDSAEDMIGMIRITGDGSGAGQGTSFCLCRECRYRHISALLKLDTNCHGGQSNAQVFLKVFHGTFASDLWSKGPSDFYKWCGEEYKGGYKGYD